MKIKTPKCKNIFNLACWTNPNNRIQKFLNIFLGVKITQKEVSKFLGCKCISSEIGYLLAPAVLSHGAILSHRK